MINTTIIIPARYASTRLAVKLLQDVCGKPLIQHTYENAKKAGLKIIIATDDNRIKEVCERFGADVCLTKTNHISGTSRLAEVIEKRNITGTVINVQGDEPLLPPELIEQVANNITDDIAMATLKEAIQGDEINNPNCVKVVVDKNDNALYFSRYGIPFLRQNKSTIYKHIGLYAYKTDFVKKYLTLAPSHLEQSEKLEQLTVLWHGYKIHCETAIKPAGIGIDIMEDLEKFRAIKS